MDFTNHRYAIDNRQSIEKKANKSIIDKTTVLYVTDELRTLLHDPTIGEALVAKSLKYLGEGQVRNIADYTSRKSHTPGRAFVKICKNELDKRQ